MSIFEEVERLQCNFLWGTLQNNRGFHPLGWNRLAIPKSHGGLGFKKLTSMNKAFRSMLAWNLIKGAKGLCAEVLEKKHMRRSDTSLLNAKATDSHLWRFVCRQSEIVELGTR